MHKVSLPPELQAELLERRGGRTRLFEHLHAQTTALLVIDMQDTFVAPNRGRVNAHARDIVPNINRLSRKLRSLGVAVVWVRTTLHERVGQTGLCTSITSHRATSRTHYARV